jgi:hypothetical protein
MEVQRRLQGGRIYIQGEDLYCNVSMVEVSTRSILYSDPHKSLPVGFPYNHALRGSDALDRLVCTVCVCVFYRLKNVAPCSSA